MTAHECRLPAPRENYVWTERWCGRVWRIAADERGEPVWFSEEEPT